MKTHVGTVFVSILLATGIAGADDACAEHVSFELDGIDRDTITDRIQGGDHVL